MGMSFSSLRRTEKIGELQSGTFDVLVIGGGITGAGIALDAALRGMRVALVEKQDFAAGTSSRSTKLIHGGLRYLKQMEVKLVAEVGRERAIVYENGPHVTEPIRMMLPFYQGSVLGPHSTAIGLTAYDWLAGVKRKERKRMFDASEALRREPLLKADGLLGAGDYVEYRTDDARLVIEVLKKAADCGAAALNYAEAEQLTYEGGKVSGARVRDLFGARSFAVRARKVVNAAGPWADTIRELDQSKTERTLRLTKGIHLVFDSGRFPLGQAVYFEHSDGRMLFAIPRDGKIYAGTTDTEYSGPLETPVATAADRTYVLGAIRSVFPSLELKEEDVESSWAGLRPLIHEEGKTPSEISRKDEIISSASGLITIAGGKLTGYRKMAEAVADRLAKELALEGRGPFRPCETKTFPISGGNIGPRERMGRFDLFLSEKTAEGEACGLKPEVAKKLALCYGSNVPTVFSMLPEARFHGQRLGIPAELYASVLYSVVHEQAVTPLDFWIRRTGALYFRISLVRKWKDGVLAAMAELLHYSSEECEAHGRALDRELEAAAFLS